MKKLMKMMLALALAASVNGAFAWDIVEIHPGGTNIMVAPPVVDTRLNWSQYQERSLTNVVVMGDFRRIGRTVIVAANSGTVTNGTLVTTNINTSVTPYITNITTTVSALAIPQTGLSGGDGTVKWFRVPTEREALRVQVRSIPSGLIVLSDDNGTAFSLGTLREQVELRGFNGALYATETVLETNSLSLMQY